jgi:hypothetical protein
VPTKEDTISSMMEILMGDIRRAHLTELALRGRDAAHRLARCYENETFVTTTPRPEGCAPAPTA